MRSTSVLLLALGFAAAPLFAGDEPKVGCKPGTMMTPFDVVDITGKWKADPKVCYV